MALDRDPTPELLDAVRESGRQVRRRNTLIGVTSLIVAVLLIALTWRSDVEHEETLAGVAETTERVEAAATEVAAISRQVEAAATEVAETTDRVEAAATEVATISQQVEAAATEVAAISQRVETVREQVEEVTEQVDQVTVEVAGIQTGTGPQGPSGPQGPQGLPGPKGSTGAGWPQGETAARLWIPDEMVWSDSSERALYALGAGFPSDGSVAVSLIDANGHVVSEQQVPTTAVGTFVWYGGGLTLDSGIYLLEARAVGHLSVMATHPICADCAVPD